MPIIAEAKGKDIYEVKIRSALTKSYSYAIDEAVDTIHDMFIDEQKRISTSTITTILMHVYDYDYASIRADLANAIVFKAESQDFDRFKVLLVLMRSIEFYCNGDYSPILDFLRRCEESDYDIDDLPFN